MEEKVWGEKYMQVVMAKSTRKKTGIFDFLCSHTINQRFGRQLFIIIIIPYVPVVSENLIIEIGQIHIKIIFIL